MVPVPVVREEGVNANFLTISIVSVAFLFNVSISLRLHSYAFYFLLGLYLSSVGEISAAGLIYRKWKMRHLREAAG